MGALVAAGGAQGRRGGGTGGEALQRAVVGGQVGRGGPFAVQLGALLLERRPGGEDLDVIARVLALGSLAFEPFFCVRAVQRKRREGERNATGLFLFCGAATRFSMSNNRTESVGKPQGKVRTVEVKHNKQFLPPYQEKRQRLLVSHQTRCHPQHPQSSAEPAAAARRGEIGLAPAAGVVETLLLCTKVVFLHCWKHKSYQPFWKPPGTPVALIQTGSTAAAPLAPAVLAVPAATGHPLARGHVWKTACVY